ncbi:MAG TPA: gamma-glutamylcyclotransferase family protein [Gemmatimonadaceae bacterium]|nr:gamma-glutamylcyclotransferase family protein [Gemmatimonadaceae bacterium]
MARLIDVFFYGLFMDQALLAGKGVIPGRVRRGSVDGYALRIGQRATLVPDQRGTAHGMVMSLSHRDIDALYADPSVQAYRPEAVIVRVAEGGALIPALCYNLVEPPAASESNPEYVAKLRAVAEKLQLPTEYLDTIR